MKPVLLAAIVACAMGLASQASAKIVEITYTGRVASGTSNGTFGIHGDLTDQDYTAFFEFDDSVGRIFSSSGFYQQTGGSSQGQADPVINSYIEINGQTVNVGGNFTDNNAAFEYGDIGNEAEGFTNGISTGLGQTLESPSAPASFDHPVSFVGYATGVNFFDLLNGNTEEASAQLSPTSATISAAPEPSTWLLMLAGIGSFGLMMRRNKREGGSLAGVSTL